MESLQQELVSGLNNLPPDVNPFDFIDNLLLERISPERPRSFEVQLVICMAVHGVCGILVVGSLLVRIFRGSFWLIHVKSKNLKLWTPHFTAGWSIWAVILVVFLELAVYNAKALTSNLQPDFAYWWTFAWIPAWMGGFSAAWAISVLLLLHLHNNSGRHVHLIEKLAPFLNALSILVPTVYLAIIIPIALQCSRYYSSAISEIEAIRDFLHSSAAEYDGRFTLLDLAPMLPIAQTLQVAYTHFQKWLRITFACYAGSAVVLVLLLATVAALYVRILRRALNEIGDNATVREDGSVHRKIMEKTYNNLVITLVSFTTLGSIFAGLSLYIAIDPGVLVSPVAAQACCLLAFYSFALFGLPTSFLLFIRSFDRAPTSTPSSNALPSTFTRGRSHSHLPSLSLPFRRKFSNDSNSLKSPLQKDGSSDEDKFTSLPRGFEIILPATPSRTSGPPSSLLGQGAESEKAPIEYPPRPSSSTNRRSQLLYYHARTNNGRESYASTTNALCDSTSTRATLSEFAASPKENEFAKAIRDGEIVESEGSQAFVFSPTSRVG
ncbi:uncharacterized protein JCM6883_005668 [Sporobolomyces salmoneus]|uniref:uncharacterized protein n=1 Tax=Sporobolomyces salmoneus TaxID=183962 RepID=UPI00317C2B71